MVPFGLPLQRKMESLPKPTSTLIHRTHTHTQLDRVRSTFLPRQEDFLSRLVRNLKWVLEVDGAAAGSALASLIPIFSSSLRYRLTLPCDLLVKEGWMHRWARYRRG